MLPPRGVSTAHWTRTNFVRAGNLPNVITHAKCQIDWYKIVPLANGWSFMFQHYYTGDAINTAKPCRAACDAANKISMSFNTKKTVCIVLIAPLRSDSTSYSIVCALQMFYITLIHFI